MNPIGVLHKQIPTTITTHLSSHFTRQLAFYTHT